MIKRIRGFHRAFVDTHRFAEPASTLLMVTIFAVVLGFLTRATFAGPVTSHPQTSVSEFSNPGGVIDVIVAGPAGQTYRAYLPGLNHRQVSLNFNRETGNYIGQVGVPSDAPDQGFCTLRIVSDAQNESDHRVRLRAEIAESGS